MGHASTINGTVLLILEPLTLVGAARIMRRAGFRVLTASSQADAARACRAHAGPIDVAVMDPALERSGKADVVPYLSVLRPEMTVLYLASARERTLYQRTGMHTLVLFQPCTAEELVSAVTEIVGIALPRRQVA